MFNLNDGLFRIHDSIIDHGIDLDRHVVARDDVLGWDVKHSRSQVDPYHLLDEQEALDARVERPAQRHRERRAVWRGHSTFHRGHESEAIPRSHLIQLSCRML